jgi:transcriptional regulator with XRE-family HTH domain
MSSMQEAVETSLNWRIAQRVRELRGARGLSLDAMAAACGVSRSMISLIERGESSPTAVVLEKLAAGLGVPVPALFDEVEPPASPVARAANQLPWRDPQSGFVRRNVSPAGADSPIRIAEVSFPPYASVAYETGARSEAVHQQVWVLEGTIDVAYGSDEYRLEAGDCLALVLDRPLVFRNPTADSARYAVVIASERDLRS